MTTVVRTTMIPKEKTMDNIPLGALISLNYRSHFVIINNQMKKLGLSAGQFFVLIVLSRTQDITQDMLARRLMIDKGAIARAVRTLEDKGFVKRITDPNNRRTVRLYLTEKGEQISPEIIRIDEEWEEAAFSGMTEEEKLQAKVLLHKIAENSYTTAHKDSDRKWNEFPWKI